MSLNPGVRIGPYEVVAPLGAGGMGEVWRARDPRLGRDVALKVLPPDVASDPERLARFAREAQLLASLNHANIAAIYGLEEAGGTRALVLELVEGPTLADRLATGALPLDEALPIARQIAEALEAAHEKGIVHRDLKPANVKLTTGGQVKVLDFGLAKALLGDMTAPDASRSPTLTAAATRAGVILGTAAYMSPEQARGKEVDRRADIWAFGCVLYETLTGRPAFGGETVSDIIAAVLRAEPDGEALPPDLPPAARELLRRCLQKDPRQRLRDIGDARITLTEILAAAAPPSGSLAPGAIGAAGMKSGAVTPAAMTSGAVAIPAGSFGVPGHAGGLAASPAAAAPGRARLARALPWALSMALAVALAAAVVAYERARSAPAAGVVRLALPMKPEMPLAPSLGPAVILSPDGHRIAFVAGAGQEARLFTRTLDQAEPIPLSGTEGANSPFFSPDGQWVAFFAQSKLKKVSVLGGAPLNVCDAENARGGAWAPEGIIYFTPNPDTGMFKVAAAGGASTQISTPDVGRQERSHRWPDPLPDGRAVLVSIIHTSGNVLDDGSIGLLSLDDGKVKELMAGGGFPRYLPTGHILYARAGTLYALPFDAARREITGPSVPILEGVRMGQTHGGVQFAFSPAGSMVYVPGLGGEEPPGRLVKVDRAGNPVPILEEKRAFYDPHVSNDGSRVIVEISETPHNIWAYDMARGTLSRLTFVQGNHDPILSPDGRRIVFQSMRDGATGLFIKTFDGTGTDERLTKTTRQQMPGSWSPDGRLLAYTERSGSGSDIHTLAVEGDRTPKPYLNEQYGEGAPAFSPDGRFIAYVSDESGHPEVYVQTFPPGGGKWQISTDGGQEPVWARRGGEMFYRQGNRMMSVEVTTRPAFTAGRPRMLFERRFTPGQLTLTQYDAFPDAQHFLMIDPGEEAAKAPDQPLVVLRWLDEVRRLTGAGPGPR